MLDFVLQKMLNRKWIVICLLIGNILMISVTCANPMYTDAIQIKTLNREVSDYIEENNIYPGTITVDAVLEVDGNESNIDEFNDGVESFKNIKNELKTDTLDEIYHYFIEKSAGITSNIYGDAPKELDLAIGYMSDIKDHSTIVSGKMYSDKINENDAIEAIVSQKALVYHRLIIGEIITFNDIILSNGEPLKVEITGVFENSEEEDLYWVNSPNKLISELFVSEKIFTEEFLDFEAPKYSLRGTFYLLLDCNTMRENVIPHLLEKTKWYNNEFRKESSFIFRENYVDLLNSHIDMINSVEATLRILQIPVLVLLIAFIFMVSGQILEIEKNDIAILKSRGAGKKQILKTYFLQSLIIAGISIVISLPVAAFICQMFGSSNSFLSFVSRGALSIRVTWTVLAYCLFAALVCIIAMIVPVFAYANTSIVEHKQKKNSVKNKPFWKKYFIDFILSGISIYGLVNFTRQKDTLAEAVSEGGSLDPLLYLCSSLFIIGIGLLILRLLPLLLKLLFRIVRNKLNPSLYAAALRILRSYNKQNFIMIFLILTLALGIFNAKAAHTINHNEEKNVSYEIGADIVLKETWSQYGDQDELVQEGNEEVPVEDSEVSEIDYIEPDFDKYSTIDGVVCATRVYKTDDGRINVTMDLSELSEEEIFTYESEIIEAYYESGGNIEQISTTQKVQLMGIHTKQFGETAWFEEELLPEHWYHYLNAISQNSSAILVSSNFHDVLGYQLGDTLRYYTASGAEIDGVIFGFVDYWPTFNPENSSVDDSGNTTTIPNYLIVANIAKLQAEDGVLPYEVWLDVDGSTQPVYDFVGEKEIKLDYFNDTYAEKINIKNDPLIQGTNGILTMGFVVVLILCAVGLLIYWIISVQSRTLQFGIFRAMGMTSKEVLLMLMFEQALIIIPTVIVGVAIGFVASDFFVPLIQIAYASTELSLPLTMAGAFGDIIKIFIAVIIAVGLCIWTVHKLVDMVKISQALKLGED